MNMIKNIRKVKILGANFDNETEFDFFNPHENNKVKTIKATLVYGKNGSGKSTIAKAFRKISGEEIDTITSAVALDDSDIILPSNQEDQKRIFVFDEDYIDRNVRLKEDHLETIVMLGHAADLTDRIVEAEEEMKSAKQNRDKQEALYKEYCNPLDVKSPLFYIERMVDALKGDDNWAGRNRLILGNKHNSPVKKDTYKAFVGVNPSKPKSDLIVEFKKRLNDLEIAQSGTAAIVDEVPKLDDCYTSFNSLVLQQLLSKVIEEPILSEREKYLLSLVQEGKAQDISERVKIFSNTATAICPYCFQTITPKHKESLIESIQKVLNDEVTLHQGELKDYLLKEIDIDLNKYEKLLGCELCKSLILEINSIININNENINNKMGNPFEAISVHSNEYSALVSTLEESLNALEIERQEYNKSVVKTTEIVSDLNRINNEITNYDIADLAKQFEKQIEEYHIHKEANEKYTSIFNEKKRRMEELEAERRDIKIAIDSINACMKYIFFTEDRLKLEYIDGNYKLLSNGKNVRPCDVSVGERNIIALSYFFTSILEGQEETLAYDDEYLLVIDDPVSSYDIENRIGILSFLKYKIEMFLSGNENTKALIMTHDLKTFYDIHKILEEIVDTCKKKGYEHSPKFNKFELFNRRLIDFYNRRQEYTELLKRIYEYATDESNNQEIVIGNIMRQVLEAFATFEYKKGIESISTDENILKLLPEPEFVSYYKNLMYRLVLHGGSHKEEQVKTMSDFKFFDIITESEKKRTARDILCFIYLLNERHLLEHLEGCVDVEQRMLKWKEEIKSNAVNL